MDYNQAIDYIHAIPKFVRPLGNEKLGGLLALLENPHKHTKFVHVAGTNGKGSVSVMTAVTVTSLPVPAVVGIATRGGSFRHTRRIPFI